MEHPILNYTVSSEIFDSFTSGLKVLTAGTDDPRAKIPAVRLDLPDFDNREYSIVLHPLISDNDRGVRADRDFRVGEERRRFKDGVEQRYMYGTWEDVRLSTGATSNFGGQAYRYRGYTPIYCGEIYSPPEMTKNLARVFIIDRSSHPGILEIDVARESTTKTTRKTQKTE